MKKYLYFLFLIMFVSKISAQQPTLTIPHLTNLPPGEVLVPINVTNFNNVGSFTIKIQYLTSVVTYLGVANWHNQISGALAGNQNNVISLAWASLTPVNISQGKLVDLRFNYPTAYTYSPINFIVPECEITDENGNTLSVIYINGSVPVELQSFTATIKGKMVELKWSTATEMNNQGFYIERSGNKVTWETIGFVEGKGTTTIPQDYLFVDKNINLSKTLYYRLKQVDFDGSFEYSPVVKVEIVDIITGYELSQNYPNPFNPSTRINYSIPVAGFVTLKVYDLIGNEIVTLVNSEKEAGNYEVNFDASNLSNGVYFYELKVNDFKMVKKLVLMK